MNYDVIKDTAILTTVPEKVLRKLISKEVYCMNDAIAEMRVSGAETADLDIGFGILSIGLVQDTIHYKFTPSADFDESIKSTLLNEQNLLEDALEAALVDKLSNTYKDLL